MASCMIKTKMALVYEVIKCLVVEKKTGRGCVRPKVCDRLLQLFCRLAALPLPGSK